MKLRSAIAPSILLTLCVGCGSTAESPDGPTEQAPAAAKPEAAPVRPLAESYSGTWWAGDLAYRVEDDGKTVRGSLTEDPENRWERVEFQLSREDGQRLTGAATFVTAGEQVQGEARWELWAGEGEDLAGRTQSAYLDGEELVIFPENPLWIPVSFRVSRPEAPAPAVVDEGAVEPGPAEAGEPLAVAPTDETAAGQPEPATVEGEEQAARDAEAQAAREAEEQAARDAEEQAAREAEEQAAREAEEQAARDAEAQAAREAEAQAAREAEEQAAREAEAQAAREAEEQAAREAEEQAAREAEEQAAREAEAQAAREAEEQAARDAAGAPTTGEPEDLAAREAEEQAAREAEERAAEEQAAREAEEQAARDAEERAAREAREREQAEAARAALQAEEDRLEGEAERARAAWQAEQERRAAAEQARREAEAAAQAEAERARLEAEELARLEEEELARAEEAERARREEEARALAAAGAAPDETTEEPTTEEPTTEEPTTEEPTTEEPTTEEPATTGEPEVEPTEPEFTAEQILAKRKTPEGLAELLFEALRWGKGDLFMGSWVNEADAKYLAGDKADRYYAYAKRFRNEAWTTLRRQHPGAKRGRLLRIEVPQTKGSKGVEAKGGKLVYVLDGKEKALPLAVLLEVEDGTWKALMLVPQKK